MMKLKKLRMKTMVKRVEQHEEELVNRSRLEKKKRHQALWVDCPANSLENSPESLRAKWIVLRDAMIEVGRPRENH